MDKDQIRNKLLSLLEPSFKSSGLNPRDISQNQNFIEVGLLDSVGFLEFVTSLESYFDVEIDFSDLDPSEFSSLENLTDYLSKV